MAEDAADVRATLSLMSEEYLAARIRYEMEQRGWSQERMAKEMTDAGHPFHQSAVSKIVNPKDGKRRSISVDDALGFAKVFGTTVDDLLMPLEVKLAREARDLLIDIAKIHQRRIELDHEADEKIMRLTRMSELPNDPIRAIIEGDGEGGLVEVAGLTAAELKTLDIILPVQYEEWKAWSDRVIARCKWIEAHPDVIGDRLTEEWKDFIFGLGPKPHTDEQS